MDDDWQYISSVFLSRSGEMMRREAFDSTMRLAAVMVERRMVMRPSMLCAFFSGCGYSGTQSTNSYFDARAIGRGLRACPQASMFSTLAKIVL